jgi:uncharacterized iron-regulated protein
MAFQSFEELIRMASTNPKRAQELVQAAQKSKKPVVSENNVGYSRLAAMRRRQTQSQKIVEERKEVGY